MIGRKGKPSAPGGDKPKGFDDFELRLGDVMRGERATLSKSLLDVQRELRIKASHIAAIENADVSAFETPSFIAGYVRSYAKYLGLDPEWAFQRFCIEADFQVAHGMSAAAAGPRPVVARSESADPFANPSVSFVPPGEAFLSKVDPRAVGSVLVLVLLIGGIGFGGWTLLHEVQKVRLAPIEQAPGVVAQLDPLVGVADAGSAPSDAGALVSAMPGSDAPTPSPEAVDRLYRPEALDVPVIVARDGPIAAIDPATVGALASLDPSGPAAQAPSQPAPADAAPPVQVVAADAPEVELLAVRPSWVRVQSADGTVIFEKILDAGERYALPKLETPPLLRAGNSGSVYFAVNGQTYGPAAPGAQVVKNVVLSPDALTGKYAVADLTQDADLARYVAVAQADPATLPAAPATE